MKGKKLVRMRTSRSSPKSAAQQELERSLEVGEGDALVDGEPLDLVEDRVALRIGRVAPVDAAERDHVDGRLLRLHRPHLRGRRLGAEDDVVAQVVRVQRRAGDVALGHVQLVEDVLDGLDLVAVDDLVAEADEDVLDLPADLRDRVEPAARDALAGKRDVDALLESLGEALAPDSLLGLLLCLPRAWRATRSASCRSRGRGPGATPAAGRPGARESGR